MDKGLAPAPGPGLACSWWGLGPEGSALDCSAPEGSVGLGVTAFSHHRPTRGQACTLKVKYTIQNTLNQSIVWSWYFGIMILLHFASSQTKRLHAGRQGPRLSFWCWDEGPLRGSYTETAVHTLGQLHTFKLIWTVCTEEGRWAEIVFLQAPRMEAQPKWKQCPKMEAQPHCALSQTPNVEEDTLIFGWLGSTLAQWWNVGQIERLPENFVISQFHIFIHTITIFPISFARSYQGLSSRTKKIFDRANIMYLDW